MNARLERPLRFQLVLLCVCAIAVACHPGTSQTQDVGTRAEAARAEAPAMQPAVAEAAAESARAIQLGYTPLESPTSQLVVVGEGGEARALSYNRYQLTVVEARRGLLPQAEARRLFDGAGGRDFRAFFKQRDYGGGGVEEGDLFYLALRPSGGSAGGIMEKAPDALRAFVRDLLALSRRLDASPLADAYVRSSPVEASRLEALRADGRIQFREMDGLPADVKGAVLDAVTHPDDFRPLGRAQYDRLLKLVSHARDLFVQEKGSGHQLTLFLSSQPPTPTEGAPK